MNGKELQALRKSAELCQSRTKLINHIASLRLSQNRLQRKLSTDPQEAAMQAMEKELAQQSATAKRLLIGFCGAVATMLALTALQYVIPLGGVWVSLILSVAVFVITFFCLDKRRNVKLRRQYYDQYLEQFENSLQNSRRDAAIVDAELQKFERVRSLLEQKMRDPSFCIIPEEGWVYGMEIYNNIVTGKDATVAQAIRSCAEMADFRQRLAEEPFADDVPSGRDPTTIPLSDLIGDGVAEAALDLIDTFEEAARWKIFVDSI